MQKPIKNIARLLLMLLTGIILASALPSCKASRCDCPEFGGHRLRH